MPRRTHEQLANRFPAMGVDGVVFASSVTAP
jgi:hypothetical protein